MANTVVWRTTNSNPPRYLVKNSRSRPIGLDRYRSMAPPLIRSGKMPAVEIRARISAPHLAQMPIRKKLNAHLYQNVGLGTGRWAPKIDSPSPVMPTNANPAMTTAERISVIQNIRLAFISRYASTNRAVVCVATLIGHPLADRAETAADSRPGSHPAARPVGGPAAPS